MVKKCTYWNKYLLMLVSIFFISTSLFAQSKQVSGLITGQDGDPIIGASIVVKGTYTGTVTDFDGKYTIGVEEENAFLVYSFLGMKTIERPVAGKTIINVTMENETIGMDEVVVVGYGVQKKADLTGSVSTVKGEDLKRAQAPNIMNAMAGKMTGVLAVQSSGQPGKDSPKFFIRGQSTTGNSDALTIVDGIERSFSSLDPNDIENITILKDAAATAVYGARAANGVVLVTTKRGKVGKVSFNYSGNFSLQTPTKRPELFNSYEYAKYYREAEINQNGGVVPADLRFTEDDIEKYKLGTDPHYPNTNWYDQVFDDYAPMQTHNLSVSGGTAKTKYYFSFGALNQKGLSKSLSYDRYSIRSNIDTEITDNLSVSLNLYGEMRKTEQPPSGLSGAFADVLRAHPTVEPYVGEGYAQAGELGYNGFGGSPIGMVDQAGYNTLDNDRFESSLTVNYKIPGVEGLSVKGLASFDKTFVKDRTFKTPYDVYFYDQSTDAWAIKANDKDTKISLSDERKEWFDKVYQFHVNYDRTFGDHKVGGVFVFEREEKNSSKLKGARTGFISSAVDQLFAGNVDLVENDGSYGENVREGYVMRVNYGYKGKYLFQLNGRYDGSYIFERENRWGFFPAASVGWRVSEESFMDDLEFLDNLKLRASYGQIGNDRVGAFQYLDLMSIQKSQYYLINGIPQNLIIDGVVANPNITWETATNYDLGVDFSLWNGLFSGELGGFYKRTEDILVARSKSIPTTFGGKLPKENMGIVDLKGAEVLLNFHKQIGEVDFSLSGNATYSKSEVINIDEAADVPDAIKQEGRPFGQKYGYKSSGLFKTQEQIDTWTIDQDGQGNASLRPGDIIYQDFNEDGVINGDDRQHIGKSSFPTLVYGLNLSAKYRAFDIKLDFQGAGGHEKTIVIDAFLNDRNTPDILADSFREGNENAKFPRMEIGLNPNNTQTSDFWIYDASYFRLKNLQIGYNLPKTLLNKFKINSARVSLSGTNLLTFSAIDFMDPEANSIISYPQMKTYTLGVNVSF